MAKRKPPKPRPPIKPKTPIPFNQGVYDKLDSEDQKAYKQSIYGKYFKRFKTFLLSTFTGCFGLSSNFIFEHKAITLPLIKLNSLGS